MAASTTNAILTAGRAARQAGAGGSMAARWRACSQAGIGWLAATRSLLVSAAVHAAVLMGLALSVAVVQTGERGPPLEAQLAEAARPEVFTALQPLALALPSEIAVPGTTASASQTTATGGTAGAAPPRLVDVAPSSHAGYGSSLLTGLEEGLRVGNDGGESATFFGLSVSGQRFIYVVDFSASMEGGRFRRARGELRRSLKDLRPTQQFFVLFFNTAAFPMPGDGLRDATQGNLLAGRKWIDRAECVGDTDPWPALEAALDMKADAIFFLTDGNFDPAVVERIQPAESSRSTPIHTIGFMDRSGEKLLKEIARRTGGGYRFVP